METSITVKRAQNREKQRIWREKNLERSREIKRIANWKVRGEPKQRIYLEKPPKVKKEPKPRKNASIHDSDFLEEKRNPIEVSLCMGCYRKYLSKYHCMWCNGEIKEIYYARTENMLSL